MVTIKRAVQSPVGPNGTLLLETGQLVGIGDSQLAGFKAANYPTTGSPQGLLDVKDRWFNQVATRLRLSAVNLARSGWTIARLQGDDLSQLLSEEKNYIFCAGTNDTRFYPTSTATERRNALRKSQKALQFLCFNLAIPETNKKRAYRSGEFTFGNTWNVFQPGNNFAGGASTTVVGATATATVAGTSVVVAFQGRSNASNIVSFSVTIDGVNMGTFRSTDPDDPIASSNPDTNYGAALVFDNLRDGNHTVVITTVQIDAGLPLVLFGVAGTVGTRNLTNRAAKLYIGNIYQYTQNIINGGYNPILREQINAMIKTTCGLFAKMGYNVTFVDVASSWNPNDPATPPQDNLHITPEAAPRVARVFIAAIDPGQKYSQFSLASTAIIETGWGEWEPNLFGSTDNPTLFGKSFSGRYRIVGKTCEFTFTMSATSITKTTLTDQIRFNLPVFVANNPGLFWPVQQILLYNRGTVAAVGNHAVIQPNSQNATVFVALAGAAPVNMTYEALSFGALNTGFQAFCTGSYEIMF